MGSLVAILELVLGMDFLLTDFTVQLRAQSESLYFNTARATIVGLPQGRPIAAVLCCDAPDKACSIKREACCQIL